MEYELVERPREMTDHPVWLGGAQRERRLFPQQRDYRLDCAMVIPEEHQPFAFCDQIASDRNHSSSE